MRIQTIRLISERASQASVDTFFIQQSEGCSGIYDQTTGSPKRKRAVVHTRGLRPPILQPRPRPLTSLDVSLQIRYPKTADKKSTENLRQDPSLMLYYDWRMTEYALHLYLWR